MDKVTVIWPTTQAFVVLCSVNPDILMLQTERNLRSGRMGVLKFNQLITAASVIVLLLFLERGQCDSNLRKFSTGNPTHPESFRLMEICQNLDVYKAQWSIFKKIENILVQKMGDTG